MFILTCIVATTRDGFTSRIYLHSYVYVPPYGHLLYGSLIEMNLPEPRVVDSDARLIDK